MEQRIAIGFVEPGVTRGVPSDTEPQWVRRCIDGDAAAWAWLVRRYEASVGRQMWRFSRDRAVWDELVQDVFVEVFRSLRGYANRRGVPLEHWIRRIATRVGYRHWKRQAIAQRRARSLEQWGRSTAAIGPESMTPSEAGELLHRLLAQLGPADRLVLTLHYLEECDTKQIAARTGWTRAMVKMRALRARRKLQRIAQEQGLGEMPGSKP